MVEKSTDAYVLALETINRLSIKFAGTLKSWRTCGTMQCISSSVKCPRMCFYRFKPV